MDFENPNGVSTRSPDGGNLKFERPDWSSFRTVTGLQQKAGVPVTLLRRLVLKELADNALDTGAARVRVGRLSDGGYFVEDEGPGIDGTPEEIARLFSINRPMVSTKYFRLPTRGALGNGLRVVAGSVLASEGSLVVTTGNRRIELKPEHSNGSTTVVSVTSDEFSAGTRVEIRFGPAIPEDADALYWATEANYMARGKSYTGKKSSPYWYDAPQFHELLSASGKASVRELVAHLDGCTGGRAGEIVAEVGLSRMACGDVNREQSDMLLEVARDNAREVTPKRLGAVGPDLFPDRAYATSSGVESFGTEPQAEIPFVVEAWAKETPDMRLLVCVNRTPVTGNIEAVHNRQKIDLFGCGLAHTVAEAPRDKNFAVRLNITTPYMPITSDGKEPDLEPFLGAICDAVAKAVRKAKNPRAKGERTSAKSVVLDNLDDAIAAQGGLSFGERQLFYFLRPIVLEKTGKELTITNWKKIIGDYEYEHGDIPGMYHPPRGSITHPHRDESIPLGTLSVESYERPEWLFNKLLFIEKEGATEALKQDRWLERHDCMVMSSVGFSTKAAKDLIDKLAEHDEPVDVYCATDADGYGGMIYQTLQEATKARGARKIRIIHIGLQPWEAVEMGLEVETLEEADNLKPVANYIRERPDGDYWVEWLQTHRVELNAMTTPQLIAWLDRKMAEFGSGKLIPPEDVLEEELADRIEREVRADITDRILREAKVDEQVAAAVAKIKTPDAPSLEKKIKVLFKRENDREWRDAIEAVAAKLTS